MGKLRDMFRRKENPAYRSILATVAPGSPRWTPRDYENLAKEGYQNCAIAFGCIKLLAQSGSRISWILKRGTNEIEDHPFLRLLRRPNEAESGTRFFEKLISYYLMDGNSYVIKVHGIEGAERRPPRFLYSLRPDRMKVIPSKDWRNPIMGWEYRAAAVPQTFRAEDVLHLMEFHPTDDWYGFGRLEVAGYPIDILAESMRWNKSILQNDMAPTLGLNIKSSISPEQRKMLHEEISGKYAGSDNARRVVVTEGEATWTPLIVTPKDLDWKDGNRQMMRWICSVFNVWSGLVGDNESTTYSNYQEGRKALYEEGILPIMDIVRDEFQYWLVPLFGDDLTLDYDRDSIEALQEERGKKYTYLEATKFLSTNEKRVACGYDEVPEGNDILVGLGSMSLSDAVAPAGDLSAQDDKSFKPCQTKSLGGFWRGENERKALWQNFERRIVQKEKGFVRDVEAYLRAQGETVAEKYRQGAANHRLLVAEDAIASYIERFRPRYRKLYASGTAAGRRMAEGKLYEFIDDGKAVDDLPPHLRTKLEKLIEDAARVITDETISEIQAVLREATGSDLTTQEIVQALRDKVDTLAPARARRIARTETAMLENCGNLDGFKQNETINRKGWLCSFVPASRDAHIEADGKEVGIDDTFSVGRESLEYPGDRSHGASAGNVINCLCAVYPAVE